MHGAVDSRSDPEEKIALFRSLFRGREDVFPVRFESRKTGRAGYQPACENEWERSICDKPRIKCSVCSNRKFVPVSCQTIERHLRGEWVVGVYPMLLDETCFFLAIDFDKAGWMEDVAVVSRVCERLNVPRVVERSRSGNGGHLWIFFEEAVPACLARKLGAHLLTEAMEERPDVGLDSYDRMFPNQDTMPSGGFGNLIALPLQGVARKAGNSVYIDGAGNPFPDQWAYLSGVDKIGEEAMRRIVEEAERRGRVVGVRVVADEEDASPPWAKKSRHCAHLPIGKFTIHEVQIVLSNEIYVDKTAMPKWMQNALIRLASFQNPEFYRAQAMRLSTHDKPRVISCAMDHGAYLGLPRGCLDEVTSFFKRLKIKVCLQDERIIGQPLDVTFKGVLREEQVVAAEKMALHDMGVLAATTAFGKTVVGAWLIARRGVSTLILVHRRQLLEQWRERLSVFLGIPLKEIGQIGGGKKKANGLLDVGIIQSLTSKGEVDERVAEYGHVMVDECHHISAFSFEQVIRTAKAKYVTGLTATIARKDGQHPIILMESGPVRYRVNARQQAAKRPFEHKVMVRPTSFSADADADGKNAHVLFQELYAGLATDESRNRMICEDVAAAVQEGRSPLVLTERKEHVITLGSLLADRVRHVVLLQSGLGVKKRRVMAEGLASIPEGEGRVLLATGRLVGEGFDDARLDTLFLALPVSWRGTIAQYAGRLHRSHDQKKEVRIYDYADLNVPMLSRMFDRRCKGYEAIGYTIFLPASAVAGWPPEVPLPVEPEWKKDYAASVRCLVRDGVDAKLGNLFVWATRQPEAVAQGADRARSATEAFLWKRLETMPGLSGHFELNGRLGISFGGVGYMEVDFLCREAKVALEIDGEQHLHDTEAYRRDRHKDVLLQEHGYFVLRYLAEDVGKRLNEVLDGIQRALVHRNQASAHQFVA